MAIPYTNRSATFDIPDFALEKLVEEKVMLSSNVIIDDISTQFANILAHVECVTQISAKGFRATFKSAQALEETMNSGVTIRGYPLTFRPVSTYRWVTVRRLPYGIPGDEVTRALAPYGEVQRVKSELHKGVFNGDRSALVDIGRDIPSLLRIKGHNCQIFYRGQPRTCFRCNLKGHESKACPGRAVPAAEVSDVIPQQDVQVCDSVDKSNSKSVDKSGTKRSYSEVINGEPNPSTSATKTISTIDTKSHEDSEEEYESSHEEALDAKKKTMRKENVSAKDKVPPVDQQVPKVPTVSVEDKVPSVDQHLKGADKVPKVSTVSAERDQQPDDGRIDESILTPLTQWTPKEVVNETMSVDIPTVDIPKVQDKIPKVPTVSSDSESDIADEQATPNVFSPSGAKSKVKVKPRAKGSVCSAKEQIVIPSRVQTRPRLPYSGVEKRSMGDKLPPLLRERSSLGSKTPELQCRRRGAKPKAPSGDL